MIEGAYRLSGLIPAVRDAAHYGVSYLDAYGISTNVTSGARSHAEQQRLYALFKAGRGAPANPPGQSAHEYGMAVDITALEGSKHPNQRWVQAVFKALGFANPFPAEPWHFEVPGWRSYLRP